MIKIETNMMFKEVCRICLEKGELKSVFTTKCLSSIEISCADAISKLSNVSMDVNDGLPNQICKKCLTKLKAAYKFKLLCENSHSKLIEQTVCSTNFSIKTEPKIVIKEDFDMKIEESISQNDLKNQLDLNLGESQINYTSEKEKSELPINDEMFLKPDVCLKKYRFSEPCHLKSDFENEMNENVTDISNLKTEKEKKFQCEFCAKIFVRATSLRTHILIHKKKLPFRCSYPGCDKTFPLNSRLKLHLKVHTNERNYICQYCSHAARNKQQLIGHIRHLHTKEKKFICGICGKGFATPQDRYNHGKRHENIRNHHCPHCDKNFVFASGLRSHLVSHAGEKQFQCSICSSRFKRIGHKVRHEVRVHGVDKTITKKSCVLFMN